MVLRWLLSTIVDSLAGASGSGRAAVRVGFALGITEGGRSSAVARRRRTGSRVAEALAVSGQ